MVLFFHGSTWGLESGLPLTDVSHLFSDFNVGCILPSGGSNKSLDAKTIIPNSRVLKRKAAIAGAPKIAEQPPDFLCLSFTGRLKKEYAVITYHYRGSPDVTVKLSAPHLQREEAPRDQQVDCLIADRGQRVRPRPLAAIKRRGRLVGANLPLQL